MMTGIMDIGADIGAEVTPYEFRVLRNGAVCRVYLGRAHQGVFVSTLVPFLF